MPARLPVPVKAEHDYFHLLDAIRGIAAIVIVVRHAPVFFGGWAVPQSYLAVDLFFVLSGVVVANAYESRVLGGMSVQQFTWTRLVRIYPLYILGTVLGLMPNALGLIPVLAAKFAMTPALPPAELGLTLLLAALVMPNLWSTSMFPLNGPAWSLFFELVANSFYAAALRFLDTRALIVIMLISASGLAVWLYVHPTEGLDVGFGPETMLGGAFRVGYSFFAGVLLYRQFKSRQAGRGGKGTKPLASWTLLVLVSALLLARPPQHLHIYYDFIAVVAVFPALIYLGMGCKVSGNLARLFATLGALSYAIYALHEPLIGLARGALVKLAHISVDQYVPYIGLLFLGWLMLACWLLDRHYDAPLRRALMRRFPPIKSAAVGMRKPLI
jgi:peptidoglycan/LPS O-acetylase OafA/YrhL